MVGSNPRNILEDTFRYYTSYAYQKHGTNTLDGLKFARLCRESKLIGDGFTATDADLIFQKVVPKHCGRMDFRDFTDALTLIAYKKYSYDPSVESKLVKVVLDLEAHLDTLRAQRCANLVGLGAAAALPLVSGRSFGHQKQGSESHALKKKPGKGR